MQSGNLYVYCMNDPVMYVDESGELATRSQIHNWVVEDIRSNYQDIEMIKDVMITFPARWGFADLISLKTGEVWEVKRKTVPEKKAIEQLKRYTNNTIHNTKLAKRLADNNVTALKTGGIAGTRIAKNKIHRQAGAVKYTIDYWDCENGIIKYDYTTKIDTDAVAEMVCSMAVLMAGLIAVYITAGAAIPTISDLLVRYEESLSGILRNAF